MNPFMPSWEKRKIHHGTARDIQVIGYFVKDPRPVTVQYGTGRCVTLPWFRIMLQS